MDILKLISICGSAFIAVFSVLAVIAIVMRIIVFFFPKKVSDDDSAIYAAIASTISRLYPASQITKIEEVK